MKTLFTIFLFFFCTFYSQAKSTIRVACVGNSITYGVGVVDRNCHSYPAQLQQLLGNQYEVRNFGKSGTTLLAKGHRPYILQAEYKNALEFSPDIVIIHLGINDTGASDWALYKKDFISDYLQLISSFKRVNQKAKVYICSLTPLSHRHKRFKAGSRDSFWRIQNAIHTIASIANVTLIDLHSRLYSRPNLFPDGLHPNEEGACLMAKCVYQYLTGDFGGLKLPAIYSDGMVLQRDCKITLHGTANSNDTVFVTIREQKHKCVTSENGHWEITLSPLALGNKTSLSVYTKNRNIKIRNVQVGDVWLCSGQSNMAFKLKDAVGGEIAAANARKNNICFYNMCPNIQTWDSVGYAKVNSMSYFSSSHWKEANETVASEFSAIGYYFGKMLSDSLSVPIGLINNAVGGSPTEAWIDRKTMEFHPVLVDMLSDWNNNEMVSKWCRTRAKKNLKGSSNVLQRHPFHPSYLYETGIAPIAGFPIKGVIWYQGESNADNVELHEKLFPALIESWRRSWKKDLPFYFVQLSSIDRPSWPYFRDSQRRFIKKIPKVSMIVSSDLGDSLDVHPKRKKEIGERLALAALNKEYGFPVVCSGPLVKKVTFIKGVCSIEFKYSERLRSSDGGKIRGFELAGKDHIFYPADVAVEQNILFVTSDKVKEPEFVRYSWEPYSKANLVNDSGLPASTFTTEEY